MIMAHLDWGWIGEVFGRVDRMYETVDGKYREHGRVKQVGIVSKLWDFKDHTIGGMACSE